MANEKRNELHTNGERGEEEVNVWMYVNGISGKLDGILYGWEAKHRKAGRDRSRMKVD